MNLMPGFNPWWVFSGLATMRPCHCRLSWRFVSIPGGFFQALQLRPPPTAEISFSSGFNPWWVFSGLATEYNYVQPFPYGVFQSLVGFFRPCNGVSFKWAKTISSCFNPWWVFSGLATVLCGGAVTLSE